MLRWHFDVGRDACRRFVWGGCGGNANNFADATACSEACPLVQSTPAGPLVADAGPAAETGPVSAGNAEDSDGGATAPDITGPLVKQPGTNATAADATLEASPPLPSPQAAFASPSPAGTSPHAAEVVQQATGLPAPRDGNNVAPIPGALDVTDAAGAAGPAPWLDDQLPVAGVWDIARSTRPGAQGPGGTAAPLATPLG